jgi:hypothetical protein
VPPDVSVIHEAAVDVVHAQPACVVTVNVPVAAVLGIARRTGLTENVHDGFGSVTTKVWPATVSVADLGAVVVFAAAVKLMLPEPRRPVPLEMVTHEAPLVAFHAHPVPVATETRLLPPPADIARLVGEIVYEHGAAACVIVNKPVPTAIVPVRPSVPVLAATE